MCFLLATMTDANSYHIILKHLLSQTQWAWSRLSSTIHCGPPTWIWTRCLEGNIYPFDVDLACYWRKYSARSEQVISTGACIWEGDNMPVHRKSLSDAQASCKGFWESSAGKHDRLNNTPTAWLTLRTQCALLVFEGMLHTWKENTLLRTLLFDLAMWHAYAKLRLHTDTTLNNFRMLTSTLGDSVCTFIKDVCSQYNTSKLPHKMAACSRRESVLAMRSHTSGTFQRKLSSVQKKLNLLTYKFHTLGDYPDLIARFGITDNANTQTASPFSHKYTNCTAADLDTGRITAQDDKTPLVTYGQYISVY